MISADALKPSAPPQQSSRWPWLLLTGNVVVAFSFWLPADVFFALLLVGPMLLLAALESARSFAEQVLKHRQVQERQARRAFMAERKIQVESQLRQAS